MIRKLTRAEFEDLTREGFDNISDDDVDEMAIPSYRHANPLIRWLMWRRYEEIARLGKFNSAMRVLEFGCGSGVFLPELNDRCGEVLAVELFPEYAERLVAKFDLSVQFVSQMEDVADESLDLVIAADVLEHIEDLDPYLKLFAAKLNDHGRFLVSGPTENFVYQIGRVVAGFGDKGDYHHTNIDALINKISAFGFDKLTNVSLPFLIPPHLFKICEFGRPV